MGSSKFAAVTIVAARECCSAVQEYADQKILAAKAPRLPLDDCTSPSSCQCRSQLAAYKVPRRVVTVEAVQRRPTGKADLAWARERLLATEPSAH